MRIFFWTKKHMKMACFFFILLFFFLIACSKISLIFQPTTLLSCNSPVSNDFINTIQTLTNGSEKIAYLTFDDGPTTSVTPKILDILKQEEITATFFVIGKSVEEHPEIVKRAYEEGHYIANHGYSHNNSILYKNSESFINEIQKTDIAIGNAIDEEDYCSHVFRFPNGFCAPLYHSQKEAFLPLLTQMNYAYIDWNCLTKDSERKYSNQQLLENLKQSANNKNTLVVLMHDTKDVNDSSLVLKDVISYLKSQGYEFRNFYDILAFEDD